MMESGPVLCDIPSVKHKRAAPRRPEPQLEGYQYNARKRWLGRAATGSGAGHAARAGADWLGRAAAAARLAGAGPRRPRRRRLAGAPRRPKTEYFDASARGVCEGLRPSGLAMA